MEESQMQRKTPTGFHGPRSPRRDPSVHRPPLQFRHKYGPVFKTSLFGLRVVASADPEFSYTILQQEASFAGWHPDSFASIFGPQNLPYVPAPTYKHARSVLWKMFGLDSLREKLIPDFEQYSSRFLQPWSEKPSIDVHDARLWKPTRRKLKRENKETHRTYRKNPNLFTKGTMSGCTISQPKSVTSTTMFSPRDV
ncbi:hypothetical protein ACLOJK_005092 [Asimina triloba]